MNKKLDILILYVLLIFLIGIMNLYSASYNFSGNYITRQIIWFLLSILVASGVYFIGIRRILNLGWVIYIASILLLIIVLVLPAEGVRRWIKFGFLNIQPSQIMKFALPVFLASVFYHSNFKTLFSFIMPLFFTLLGAVLIAKEPDLGGSLMLFPSVIAFFILKKASLRKALPWIIAALMIAPILYFNLKPYQKNRILTFMNPERDPLGAGYTLMQSKIAVGSGNIIGKGWLNGAQGQLRFLPESHTDFVFPVFAEEWGFLGVVALLGLYLLMLRRMHNIACRKKDGASGMLLNLFLITISVQIIVNIGMTIGIFPIVGLPLPFFSYGGSDLIVTVVMVALFLRDE
ncbi:MAG: FtsW/RodA/SpoVE family cell cycle protein [Candidatus Kaelpia aquatica]|nr:FtsW/RodA/SpoVE family cell cycle protein [Candidatus Kaelpia aquatica]